MNREDFLEALAANENDANLRLVFADWLDARGEHEEAAREREWFTAREWLGRFARMHSTESVTYTYDDLIDFGRRATAAGGDDQIPFGKAMGSALQESSRGSATTRPSSSSAATTTPRASRRATPPRPRSTPRARVC